MRKRLDSLVNRITSGLALLGAVGVLAMLVHITGYVVMRNLAGAPIPATVEIVSYYYMVAIAFLPLAWVERRGGMISVELLDFMLSPRMRRVSDLLIAALGVVIYAVMAYASWLTAVRNYETGTFVVALQTKIITWPGYFLPPAGFALAAIIVTVRLLQIITGNEEPAREHQA